MDQLTDAVEAELRRATVSGDPSALSAALAKIHGTGSLREHVSSSVVQAAEAALDEAKVKQQKLEQRLEQQRDAQAETLAAIAETDEQLSAAAHRAIRREAERTESLTKVEVLAAFATFDTDHNGRLSASELAALLSRPGSEGTGGLSPDEVAEIIADFDQNGDGELDVDELAHAFTLAPWLIGEPVDAVPREQMLLTRLYGGCDGDERKLVFSIDGVANLTAKEVTDDEMRPLYLLLAKGGRRLRELQLSHNHLSDAGAETLSQTLRMGVLPNLTTLDLSHNALGDTGLAALVAALQGRRVVSRDNVASGPPHLTGLVLAGTHIGDAGVATIGSALREGGGLSHLRSLNLFKSANVGDEGMTTLAAALADEANVLLVLDQLTFWGVGNAPPGDAPGAVALAAACEKRGITLA